MANSAQQTGPLGTRIPMVSLLQAVAVAEHLNFRHAAAALGVSQSSVSARIKALEVELGVPLFERWHRGVRLTEAGRNFVIEVSRGIELLDHAIKTAGTTASGTVGRLRLGLHSSLASGFLADLLLQFREQCPQVELAIIEGCSSDTIRQVREGILDIAFALGGVNAPDCHARLLWVEPMYIALPEKHSLEMCEQVRWDELAAETFLVRVGGTGPQVYEHIVRRIVERRGVPHISRCDVGRDTLMHLVGAGEGNTLVSEAATLATFPGVVYRRIGDEPDLAHFSAVWSPHNTSPALKRLLSLATSRSRAVLAR